VAEPLVSTTRREQASAGSGQRAIRSDPPIVEGITKRAYAELKQGHWSDAIYLATQAIRLDPSRASAYIALAGARDAMGDHAGAAAAFRDCAQRAQDRMVSACRTLAR
jgi:tetratricopeptide (TPR) repeat protein